MRQRRTKPSPLTHLLAEPLSNLVVDHLPHLLPRRIPWKINVDSVRQSHHLNLLEMLLPADQLVALKKNIARFLVLSHHLQLAALGFLAERSALDTAPLSTLLPVLLSSFLSGNADHDLALLLLLLGRNGEPWTGRTRP
jgi:hypothetical protein